MNKYLNPHNYCQRLRSFLNYHMLDSFESFFTPAVDMPLRNLPIFFLGAPRSGSTFAFQVITDAFDLGYISNRHCQWFGAPSLAEHLFHPLKNRPNSDYRSKHGVTNGNHAPSECGEWWYRFFRRSPPYVTLNDVDPQKMHLFRQSIAALTSAFDRPILFKNLYASLRIQAIAHYIPESLFIIMHREEVDNGHSLLETRSKCYGNYERWWSMEPSKIEKLRILPAHMQVIEQIRHIHTTIERDLEIAEVSKKSRFDLNYEDLCKDTHGKLSELEHFFSSNQCMIQRTDQKIPTSFEKRGEIRIDEALYSAMASYARKL